MKQDLGIINGRIYLNGEFVRANLYCRHGVITEITTQRLECQEEVDAKGDMVLPGLIDPHVHFHLGMGASVNQDDFERGSQKAILGGITTYLDFLDPVKSPDEIPEAFRQRMELAKKSYGDYGFHGTVANPSGTAYQMTKNFMDLGIYSIKLFTTYAETDRRTYDGYIRELLQVSHRENTKVVVHAENHDLIWKNQEILVKDHEKSRDALCERTEIGKLAEMAKTTQGNLYIVHVSAGSSVEYLVNHYQEELKQGRITLESCPHYYLFNSEKYQEEDGYRYTMTPPLRPESDRLLLHQYIDAVDVIGTDHCPYEIHRKNRPFTRDIPMGIGGIEYSFLIMYTLFGEKIISKFTSGPAKAYGLFPVKGNLLPGAHGDIVIFQDSYRSKVEDPESPYDQQELKGRIRKVYLRGKLVAEDGILGPALGQYLRRDPVVSGKQG